MPLCDKNCLKEDAWANTGIQGEILMEIRDDLSNCPCPVAMDVADSFEHSSHAGNTSTHTCS